MNLRTLSTLAALVACLVMPSVASAQRFRGGRGWGGPPVLRMHPVYGGYQPPMYLHRPLVAPSRLVYPSTVVYPSAAVRARAGYVGVPVGARTVYPAFGARGVNGGYFRAPLPSERVGWGRGSMGGGWGLRRR